MSRPAHVMHISSKAERTYDDHAIIQKFAARGLAERIFSKRTALGCVLEIGCGTGILSTHLANHADFYVLTEPSPALLEVALQKVPLPHVVPLVVDGDQLCFTASFDLIVSNLALHWFRDPKAAIGRLVASLKPGGELFLTIFGNNSFHEWRTAHHLAEAPCGLLDFTSIGQLKDGLPLTGHRYVEEEWVTVKPKNALTFLRALKGMGRNLAHPGYKPLPQTTLKKVMATYDEDPKTSCQILYGYYQKPEKMREE